MKIKSILALTAATLTLSACVIPDAYYDERDRPHHHDRSGSVYVPEDEQHHDYEYRREIEHNHRHESHRRYDEHRRDDRRSGINSRFNCENGLSVQVRSLSTDRIELRLDDRRAVLTAARSGSGERYTANQGLFGRGAEWHQKGNEAFFAFTDPYGNPVETSCRTR